MSSYWTVHEAKDFLAGMIAVEAEQEGTPLSEMERKMLYFSETDWTLPDMKAVSAEFDKRYDQSEYEQKIARLVHKIKTGKLAADEQEKKAWNQAVEKLSEGDHYLLVLIEPSHSAAESPVRPPHDRLKLWLTAIGIVVCIIALMALTIWLRG